MLVEHTSVPEDPKNAMMVEIVAAMHWLGSASAGNLYTGQGRLAKGGTWMIPLSKWLVTLIITYLSVV